MTRHVALALIICVCASDGVVAAKARQRSAEPTVRLDRPVREQGTIRFQMRPDRWYRNGQGAKKAAVNLLEIPGVAELSFRQAPEACQLRWVWNRKLKAEHLIVNIPELPGPDDYFVLYTWDAKKGRLDAYVNDTALRLPDTKLRSWKMPPVNEILPGDGQFQIGSLSAEPRYLRQQQAEARVPDRLRGRHAALFGVTPDREPIKVEGRLGKLIYRSALDNPQSVAGWVMEGPGIVRFQDGWMEMASKRPDGPDGHLVHWCPRDFPDRFVAAWEIKPVSRYGLCIVFFAAKGERGQDIFDKDLPKRTGVFSQYTRGAIKSYHVSYYANTPFNPGRITSNMRKNNWFYLVSNGPPGISPGSTDPHKVRLVKDGPHTQLLVDGRVIIDFVDDGKRYGPVHADGKIGLRQMQWMVARYRNFRVWDLTGE